MRENKYVCPHCGKEISNSGGLACHIPYCKLNKNRVAREVHGGRNKGCEIWNKGITFDDMVKSGRWTEEKRAEVVSKHRLSSLGKNKGSSGIASTPEKEAERRRKISETAKKKHLGGYRPGSGRGKKGWIRGFFCDSTYELVYVLFNTDHNIKFERCQLTFEYEFAGEKHLYHPDFMLEDGTLVEVKGYHTDLVDVKAASVDRPIKVLYEDDLKEMFKWVKTHYQYRSLEDLYEK